MYGKTATRVLRTFAKFAKIQPQKPRTVAFFKVGLKYNKSLKRRSRKVTYANFGNILGNRCIKGLQGICDGINHLYGENDSDGKQISKRFAEFAVCW